MNTSFNALVIPARLVHPVHIKPVDIDLDALRRVAAGQIAVIDSKDWHAYLNNEGSRSAHNVRAEVLIREAGIDVASTLPGTALFLGTGSRGEEMDAPRHLIRLAEQLFDMPLAA